PERELVDDLERALDGFLRLQRMDVCKSRKARNLLIEARVVLHGARAEREESEVDRVILTREPRVVTHSFRLGEPGQSDGTRAFEAAKARCACGQVREIHAGLV